MPPEDGRIGGGFSEGELQFASFWVRNRLALRQFGRGALIVVNVLVWGYALWGVLDAFVISYPRESRITQEIAQNQFLAMQLEANRPKDVRVGTVEVFQGTDQRLDFLAEAINPNTDWWTSFTYQFNVAGEMTTPRAGFILPGQRLYLGEFGFTPQTEGAKSGVLVVNNIRWHRLDPAQVGGDYPAWRDRRDQFRTDDVQFHADQLEGVQRVSRSSFTFVNPSAYGFWQVPLIVVLKRSGNRVAATSVVLDRVLPGESRLVNIDWFERLPGVTETEVIPMVNVIDDSVYLPTTQL